MNTTARMTLLFRLLLLVIVCAAVTFAGSADKEKATGLSKTLGNDLYRPFLINNIFNYYGNNGDGSYNKYSTDNEGFEYLKGDGKHIIFEDGVVWGGYHKGRATAKVGGSVYRHGISAGPIITNGTATTDAVGADAGLDKHRIYRVRPDIGPAVDYATLEEKLANEEVKFISRFESFTGRDIYDQYVKDWNEWPADLGAPYTDVDADGKYDPTKDIPGQPGSDQTLWYVANDANAARCNNLAGSPPIGLEMQRTIWGYKRSGALGNTIFLSTIIINKSGAKIDSMYFVQWSDPDLGDAGDDYVGCDTTRSLGYVYNSKAPDATYGNAVPAGGFDFFQGPLVPSPGDSAVFRLKYRQGFKNLPMTTFVFFTQGNATYADPLQGPGGDIEWYRLMRGLVAKTGAQFIDPNTQQATKFTLAGDPVKGTGWNDGQGGIPAADRRMCMITGPFTMAVGDTQELVVAALGGVGADRLSSVSALKGISDLAQQAYNSLFKLPAPPPSPLVNVANLDGQAILTWGDPTGVEKTEGTVDQGFAFEGYNVYELPGPSFTNAKLLGTYDLVNGITVIADTVRDPGTGLNFPVVLQRGTDAGLLREMKFNSSKITGGPLYNGTKYYFAVTAYSYNQNPPAAAGTHSLESPAQVLTIVPQTPNPGTRYTQDYGDTLKVTKGTAPGASATDGNTVVLVKDPTRLTGDAYSVSFRNDTTTGATVWRLTNTTKNKILLDNQTNQSGDDDYAITEGFVAKVQGPPPGMKSWATAANGQRDITWAGADPQAFWHLEGYEHTIGMGYDQWFSGSSVTPDKLKTVKLVFAAADGTWDPLVAPTDANFSRGHRFLRGATNPPNKPEFAPWIINATAGYPYQDYNYSVPWAAFDMDVTPPRRLAVGHMETNTAGGLVNGKYWPLSNADAGVDNAAVQREFFFVFDKNYNATTPDPALMVNLLATETPLMWWGIPVRRSAAPNTAANFRAGTEFTINPNRVNTPAHTYNFTATKPVVGDQTLAKEDVERVNVYPNPYVGYNTAEINRYARFVTFNHLPRKATIRVFNIAGVLLRTIVKEDDSQFATWDLNNEEGFPAAAGMYVIYIDMPELGKSKILKLGVIPEQQYLDRW